MSREGSAYCPRRRFGLPDRLGTMGARMSAVRAESRAATALLLAVVHAVRLAQQGAERLQQLACGIGLVEDRGEQRGMRAR